ncbi:MAG: hypothetical protein E3J87_07145 [Candidatus Cloacimonadota bacterium]|nr:MAG: hypothetical protein E3J87_07145 [Candidatus Cloacimonadota bacterium]
MKNTSRKKRFTFHDMSLHMISALVEGVDSHHKLISISNIIPDIITEHAVHEVEAIDIRTKLNKYQALKKDKVTSRYKRVLWLTLPSGTERIFNRVNVVEVSHIGFRYLHEKRKKLKPIILPTPPFKLVSKERSIEGKNAMLKVLVEIEDKLRENRFNKEADVFRFVREKLWLAYLK